jgi:hypothetical protein
MSIEPGRSRAKPKRSTAVGDRDYFNFLAGWSPQVPLDRSENLQSAARAGRRREMDDRVRAKANSRHRPFDGAHAGDFSGAFQGWEMLQ